MKTIMYRTLAVFVLVLCSALTYAEEVWIDVRTLEEYQDDHIDGHANITLATIQESSTLAGFDKDDQIHLYCHSGRRAGEAKAILESAGFTNVINNGGIADVRTLLSEATE